MAVKPFKHVAKTITFVGAGVTDLVLRSGNGVLATNQTYIDGTGTYDIDQDFNSMTIENLSANQGAYCIEPDPSSTITVNLTAKDGQSLFKATGSQGAIIQLDGVNIIRVRIYLAGAGDVQLDLFKE